MMATMINSATVEKIGVCDFGCKYDKVFENGNWPRLAIAYIIRGNVMILPFIQPTIEIIIPILKILPPTSPKAWLAI